VKAFRCGRFELDLSYPLVMGVLNITPDSFSDGGDFYLINKAIAQAKRMKKEGVHIIDIGGESTRPQAHPISLEEEKNRILPVLEALYDLNIPLSLDTRHTAVMQSAINSHRVDMINDVNALKDKDALTILAKTPTIGICLMHMQGTPSSMQIHPSYQDVIKEVAAFLNERLAACKKAGIDASRVLIDPGFGFGKNFEHNMQLLQNLTTLKKTVPAPILVGLSRKSMLGIIVNEKKPKQRLGASIAIALEAIKRGASIVRVHDVKPTLQAIKVYQACSEKNVASCNFAYNAQV
jgi:dihydropteroate synthase